MGNVYLITGASSDVGCALIEYLYQEGDLFIAQGASDLAGLEELSKAHPGAIRTYNVDLTDKTALADFIADVQQNIMPSIANGQGDDPALAVYTRDFVPKFSSLLDSIGALMRMQTDLSIAVRYASYLSPSCLHSAWR